jgi:mannose-6-phosphate isomerase-like protein (cupin superfamily)
MSYQTNIIKEVNENTFFRKVLNTGSKSQLVVMEIPVGGDIGEEVHAHVEQMLINISGTGKVVCDGVEHDFVQGDVVTINPGEKHNFVNTGTEPLKLYTIYVPANHIDGRIHKTKEEAMADIEDEPFGETVL